MGEISVSNSSRHVLEFGNVKVLNDCIELALSSSKTDQTGVGTTIRVQGQSQKAICPLVLLTSYLYARAPYHKGLLFCHFDGSPLSRYQVSSVLTKTPRILCVDPSRYSTHFLKIGAATTCTMEGVYDEKIMQPGFGNLLPINLTLDLIPKGCSLFAISLSCLWHCFYK